MHYLLVRFTWRVQIQLPLFAHFSQSLAWHCLSKQSLGKTTRCWRSAQGPTLSQSALYGTQRTGEQRIHHWQDLKRHTQISVEYLQDFLNTWKLIKSINSEIMIILHTLK